MLLVCSDWVPPKDSSQGLEGNAGDVVFGLLGGEGGAGGLGVEAQHPGARVLSAKALAHDLCPHATGGAELGDLFQEIVVAVEEEGELLAKAVHVQPGVDGCLDIGDAVGEGEGDLLDSGRASLADVVARDADGVPVGDGFLAVAEDVGDQAHGGLRREDIGAAGDIFLEDVVLEGAAQAAGLHPLATGNRHVHRQQDRGRGIDCHAGGDFVKGDVLEEGGHVLQRGDGDADLADLAQGDGIVGVVADLGGQVKSHREAGLPLLQQVAVAAVGFCGAGVTGVLAHGPEAPAVHAGLDAAGEGVLAGEAESIHVVGAAIGGGLSRRHGDAGGGLELGFALREALEGRLEHGLLPTVLFFRRVHARTSA